MKWIKKGVFTKYLVSADNKWEIYEDKGKVYCRRLGMRTGFILGAKTVDNAAIRQAEAKIRTYNDNH